MQGLGPFNERFRIMFVSVVPECHWLVSFIDDPRLRIVAGWANDGVWILIFHMMLIVYTIPFEVGDVIVGLHQCTPLVNKPIPLIPLTRLRTGMHKRHKINALKEVDSP